MSNNNYNSEGTPAIIFLSPDEQGSAPEGSMIHTYTHGWFICKDGLWTKYFGKV